MVIVKPKSIEGWNMSIAQLWGSGPKFTIVCGKCGCTFQKRIQMVDRPCLQCPFCGAINKLPLVME